MQKYEQSLTFRGIDTLTVLALCYKAMKTMQMEVSIAGTETLVGITPKSWNADGQKIICRIEGIGLIITSEMADTKVADMGGMNKQNLEVFVLALEQAEDTTDAATIQGNKEAMESLKNNPAGNSITAQQAVSYGLNQAMARPVTNSYITYILVAVNVLVFILMTLDGAGFIDPDPLVHIRWGSDFTPYTLSGDWWRLLSSMFIHFGIIHLSMNMYCLYTLGVYLEPLLGKARYLAAYLCTGIIANIVSIWWHTEPTNSAGASGVIFGIYGVFLAMLTSSLIPKEIRNSLLQNIVIFIVYNLFFGMKSGIDNAAHAGGLVSGFAFGFLYVYVLKSELSGEGKFGWITPAIIITTIMVAVIYLQLNRLPASARIAVRHETEAFYFADHIAKMEEFGKFGKL